MNNSDFCGRCGKSVEADQNFCDACGAPVNATPVRSAARHKRKTYTALKFVALGFGIGNIFFVIYYLLSALAYYVMSTASEYAEMYLSFMPYYIDCASTYYAERFELVALIFVVFAAVFAIGDIASWVMFGVYSSKRKKALAQIICEKEEDECGYIRAEDGADCGMKMETDPEIEHQTADRLVPEEEQNPFGDS